LALVVSLVAIQLPRMEAFHVDPTILVFLAAAVAMTTTLTGLLPALRVSQQFLADKVGDGQRSGRIDPQSRRMRNGLVVCQVAMAIVLLSGAGLMIRSFVTVIHVSPGFETEHLVTMKIALPGAAYPKPAQTSAFFRALLEHLQSVPGVKLAAATTALPLSGESDFGSFQIEGRATTDWANALAAEGRAISENYFRTLKIPLLSGREFTGADAQKSTIIINRTMARKFWPGTDPVGQRVISIADRSTPREIVGVVEEVKSFGLDAESKPEMYTLFQGAWYMNLVLRTSQNPDGIVAAVRNEVAALDKGVPVYQISTMDQLLSMSVAPRRFDMLLLSLFAAFALALAALGLYGVLSFVVTRRTREIGIRLAVGAQQGQILKLIAGQGLNLVMVGIALGLLASSILTRLMTGLLYGVSPSDPVTFGIVVLALVVVSCIACYVPTRRAMQVDPAIALHSE